MTRYCNLAKVRPDSIGSGAGVGHFPPEYAGRSPQCAESYLSGARGSANLNHHCCFFSRKNRLVVPRAVIYLRFVAQFVGSIRCPRERCEYLTQPLLALARYSHQDINTMTITIMIACCSMNTMRRTTACGSPSGDSRRRFRQKLFHPLIIPIETKSHGSPSPLKGIECWSMR